MYVNDKPFNYLPITDGNPSPVSQANAIQTNGYSHMDITKIGDYLYAVMGKNNKKKDYQKDRQPWQVNGT